MAPELAPGFAVLDLVVGRTLVEIKTSADPGKFLDQWLDQVMGYLLIDRWNVLWSDDIEAGARGRLSKQYPIPPEAIVLR